MGSVIFALKLVTPSPRMLIPVIALCAIVGLVSAEPGTNRTEVDEGRGAKALSIFNVVTFPNSACGATNGYNGTCYTAAECSSLGGTASGTCASSFGVCCVFSISCGSSSSANNTYAIISSYSTSTDSDPCTYKFCKTNSDVCKLRIDFDVMVLTDPVTMSSTAVAADGPRVGDCNYDSLTVTNPGGASPPVICGYNTGQHMWVPASDMCNTINIDIDTGTTTTTRKWQIKVTQYECGNMMMPVNNCLQYHTAMTGTIATFNWDTSATTVATTQVHLSSQYYDICIRRARSYCSVCYSVAIHSAITGTASSYGVGQSSDGAAQKQAAGKACTGITTQPATLGLGDYLEIDNMQHHTSAIAIVAGTVNANYRICGAIFSADPATIATTASVCSFSTPFKIGVHFDEDESIAADPDEAKAPNLNKAENDPLATGGAGYGFSGFYLNYWQKSC